MISIIVGEMMENHDVFFENPERLSHYSNMGYVLLAYLAQEVTGKNYHEALDEYVLEPLDLKSTGQYHRMFAIDWMADGYVIPESGRDSMRKRCCFDTTSFVGSHSLYSDSSDLFLWLQTLMGENDFLTSESIERMQQAIAPVAYSENLYYGFGLFVDEVLGHKRVWHDGFESGYLSLISAIEDINLKIVILGNRHNQNVYFGQFYTQEMNNEISEAVIRWSTQGLQD
jgi:CubicO group peptidase (beta-lactamase class C family)